MTNIRVGLVGCGYWGPNIARNLASLGALAAVTDHSPERAVKVGHAHNVPDCSFARMLEDDSIDAIAISTPGSSHAELSLAALAAGKHVFVEKPMAMSVAQGEEMLAASVEAGKLLMVGHLLRYHAIFEHLHKLALAGAFGRLHYVYSQRLAPGIVLSKENALWALAPHDLSMILALAGEGRPLEIAANAADFITSGVADWASVNMRFSSGMTANMQVSWAHPFKEQRLVLIGEEGAAVFDDSQPEWSKKLSLYRGWLDRNMSLSSVPQARMLEPEYVEIERSEPLFNEIGHFVRCVEFGSDAGEPPRTSGAEGLEVVRILELAQKQIDSKA